MNLNIGLINETLAVLLEAFAILLSYYIIFDKTYFLGVSKFKQALFIISYPMLAMWSSYNVPTAFHTAVVASFSILMLSTLASIKVRKSALAILISMIFFALIELSVVAVISFISGENYFDTNILDRHIDLITYIAKFAELIILGLIIKFDKTPIKLSTERNDDNIAGYWVLGMFIMALFILTGIVSKDKSYVYQIVLLCFFFVFIVLGIVDYRKKLELIKIKNNYHLKQEYINNLEVIVDIIRKEKHDFANHINTVYAICVMNKEDALPRIKEYLKNTTNNLKDSYSFYDTGNGYVDGLIAVKSNYAFENNIHLDVDFETPLNAILIRDNDLIAVVGNILDNAMYAVSLGDKEIDKIVSVYGYMENSKYFLSIANNGPMVPVEMREKIFKKGFSTKKEDKSQHGFGLYIVNDIVRRNGGKLLFTSSQEETEFLIEFKVKEDYVEENCCETYQYDL